MAFRVTRKVVAVVAISTAMFALGVTFGGSNLGILGYPEFDRKYNKPTKPYSKDEYAVREYRRQVEQYVRDAEEYIENGSNDINRVQDAQRSARQSANEVINEYNNFVRYGH